MRAMISAALLVSAMIAPALAQDRASQPVEAKKAEPASEKKLCRRTQTTGSIIAGKSVCRTKAQWAQIDAANQEAAREAVRAGNQSR